MLHASMHAAQSVQHGYYQFPNHDNSSTIDFLIHSPSILRSLVDQENMDEDDRRPPSGCGLLSIYGSMFRRQPISPRRSASTNSLHQANPDATTNAGGKHSPDSDSKRRHSTDDSSLLATDVNAPIAREGPLNLKSTFATANYPKGAGAKPYDAATRGAMPGGPRQPAGRGRGGGISTELDSMIYDHQSVKGSSTLVRASSGNVMLYGNLGNLRAPGAVTPNRNVLDYLPKTANEKNSGGNNNNNNTNVRTQGYGPRIQKKANECTENDDSDGDEPEVPPSMCRALSKRLDPEELKEMGNEEYKKGNFAEAVALYDRAILMDPQKAAYWSNKAAALIGLGKLLDAVTECREAVRIDPSYYRAHHRLATIYLRLGEAERALHHYKLSRNEANSADISRTQAVQLHISKCNESRRLKDWNSELKESQAAISAGADSAPKVFAFKAEALIMLHRHDEAETAMTDAPKFDIDACTKFFGSAINSYVLMVRAQVDMAAGRFEDSLSLANRAARLDTSSREAGGVARKARTLASARATGNDLFKASRFEEACVAYGEGLAHVPNNAVLLCNRAACRSKLGQWEKAMEDCNAALSMRPSYSKARLRRADCNAKLARWEASVQDYEALLLDMPGDEEIGKALHEVQAQLRKQKGEDASNARDDSALIHITTKDQFLKIVMSPGLSVALFFNQSSDVPKMLPSILKLCKRYPSVIFLKVNIEAIPNFAKTECISSVPSFRIYKSGSDVEEIAGLDIDKLESYLGVYSR